MSGSYCPWCRRWGEHECRGPQPDSAWCVWCRDWQPDPLHDCLGDPDWVRSDKRKQRRARREPCPYCSNPVAPADMTAHLNRRCPKRPEETR